MRNKIILALLSIFLLSSCSQGNMAIVSESGAEVYIHDSKKVMMVKIDEESLGYLKEISGLESSALIDDLFNAEIQMLSPDSYSARENLYELLIKESLSQSRLDAIKRYGKDLRKTEFMNTINELSSEFDKDEVKRIIKSKEQEEFPLAPVLSENVRDYDTVKDFIAIWLEEAMRSI